LNRIRASELTTFPIKDRRKEPKRTLRQRAADVLLSCAFWVSDEDDDEADEVFGLYL
jgi:hypothetical protein